MHTKSKCIHPVDTYFFCDCTPQITCHKCKVLHCTLHASILCQSDICVGLRQLWVANLFVAVAAFAVVVAADDALDNTHPGVLICCKWYMVPPQYRANT